MSNENKATGLSLVTEARKWTGVPYVWGGNDEKGWDCSGFVLFVLRKAGINLPDMNANSIYSHCMKHNGSVTIDEAYRMPGVLLFRRESDSHRIVHVGFSDGDNNTIEARGKDYGTGVWHRRTGYTDAAKIPGVSY